MKIACGQFDIIPGQPEENMKRMEDLTFQTSQKGAELVVFPEVATTDYYVDHLVSLADSIPGKQSDVFSQIAAASKTYLAVGLLEMTREGVYNVSVLFSPNGAIIGKYRKTHLSVDSRGGTIANETGIFLPGDDLPVFRTNFGVVGMMICKDGDFPEVPRALAVKGAEMILWMTNRGGVNRHASIHYAASNCAVLIVANRAEGHAKGGGSVIIDWEGNVLDETGAEEKILFADIDMDSAEKARTAHWQTTRVRRPALYGILGKTEEQIL